MCSATLADLPCRRAEPFRPDSAVVSPLNAKRHKGASWESEGLSDDSLSGRGGRGFGRQAIGLEAKDVDALRSRRTLQPYRLERPKSVNGEERKTCRAR